MPVELRFESAVAGLKEKINFGGTLAWESERERERKEEQTGAVPALPCQRVGGFEWKGGREGLGKDLRQVNWWSDGC